MAAASIVGFVVVLIVLLASLGCVSFLCLKYGTCKRIVHRSPRSQSGAGVRRNHSLMVPAPARASKRSHSRRLIDESTRRKEPTCFHSPPPSHKEERASNLAPPTPLECSHHTLPSAPHTPITPSVSFSKPTSPMMAANTLEGADPVQAVPVHSPPPYRAVGCYPYQPFKSPCSPKVVRLQGGYGSPLHQTVESRPPIFSSITGQHPTRLPSEREGAVSVKETLNSTPSHVPPLSPVTGGELPTQLQPERMVVAEETDRDETNTPEESLIASTLDTLPSQYITEV